MPTSSLETSRANAPMEHAFATISGPSSYKQAMMQSDKHQWESAIDEELRSMEKNQVWEVVDTPSNKNIVTSRWVFVKKTDEHGNLERYKARLVARGFQQIPGQDFNETFAPVVRFTSIRVVLAIAAKYKMHIHQMDVKTAFLNGFLDEDIYMAIPEGVTVNNADSKCLKLKKSIYGLKQSPLSWNKVLDEFLLSNQMIRSTADSGVYMRKIQDLRIFVTTYVDDLLIASQNMALISEFKKKLESRFEMSDLGSSQVHSRHPGNSVRRTNNHQPRTLYRRTCPKVQHARLQRIQHAHGGRSQTRQSHGL